MTHHRPKRVPSSVPDMEETREHIMAAGKELLLAANGALRFCKSYVETTVPNASKTNLLSFFQKAITVADELGRSISCVESMKDAARGVAKPLLEAMDREMRCEHGGKGSGPCRKRPCKKGPRVARARGKRK